MHGRVVLHVVSMLTAFAGLTMLVPAGLSLVLGESAGTQLLTAALATALVGFTSMRLTRGVADISLRDGFAIVTLGWLAIALFGLVALLERRLVRWR